MYLKHLSSLERKRESKRRARQAKKAEGAEAQPDFVTLCTGVQGSKVASSDGEG